jgi:hypothetical protein
MSRTFEGKTGKKGWEKKGSVKEKGRKAKNNRENRSAKRGKVRQKGNGKRQKAACRTRGKIFSEGEEGIIFRPKYRPRTKQVSKAAGCLVSVILSLNRGPVP